MNVVVVESPAKAKTINKYLGQDYHVLASYGHVRDLPPKDGSVRPDEDFSMSWQVDERGEKRLREIAAAVKNSKHLFLATDPDREGEAISLHIVDGWSKASMIAFLVISLKTTRSTSTPSSTLRRFSSSTMCQEIASPSR